MNEFTYKIPRNIGDLISLEKFGIETIRNSDNIRKILHHKLRNRKKNTGFLKIQAPD